MIVVTGATGELGSLVINALLRKTPADQIVAAVRTPAKAEAIAAMGVQVREADYSRPETLTPALAHVDTLLLISSSEVGSRVPQHEAVINAAKAVGVGRIVYTSLLHADTSTLALATEHIATERYLQASGLPYTILRNGWYIENQTAALAAALEQGAFIGASKEGRFAGATRADFADAAVAVLLGTSHANQIYELAGDTAYTRSELAAEVSQQVGRTIGYHDLSQKEYETILAGFLPAGVAFILADAEAKAASGELDDPSHTLSGIIGRPTTPLKEAIANTLKAL